MDASRLSAVCPRCGYDQSGEVATWSDRCPISGTCPECGTGFDWADLFNPARQDIRWLVEHAPSFGRRLRRTGPTLMRMVLPWVFWRRVDVHARTDVGSIVRWLVVLAIGMHLLTWIPFSILFAMIDNGYWPTIGGVREYLRYVSTTELANALLTGLTWPVISFFGLRPSWTDFYGGRELLGMFRVPLGIGLTWAVVMTALPVTRRMARLRPAHVLRALLLQWTVVLMAMYAIRLLFPIGELSGNTGVGVLAAVVYLLACLWSLVWWVAALRVGWRIRSVGLSILGSVAALLGGVVIAVIEMSVSSFLAP
ncbi:MAG: hypothetical protein D6692_01185 [Planctomycetota bacterium]|nr:MAG: hypothetical protein D6692_01185 [Planctomycetota bacterium]